ncbi:lauroyl-Kdo(2)-lipid IV(A) myristoyltransferase [Shewanella sp. OPT22]|nr:lauroyl-Kdo(2)-lipid IV(A) myristoyltransferase [Shewanella sp. OPT22]
MSGKNKTFCCKFHYGLCHPKLWPTWVGISVLFLLGLLPAAIRQPIACAVSRLVKKLAKKQLRIAKQNLETCFPEKSAEEIDSLLATNIEQFVMTLVAQAELLCCSERTLRRRVKLSGVENIHKARAQGKPIMFILPHVWGVEHAGLRLNLELPMVAMAKAHRNPLFHWFSLKIRSSRGGNVYKREAGIRALLGELKKGNSFFYLPDEDLGPKQSVFAPFFGTMKATLPVVSRLAKAGNAEVLPVKIGYDRKEHCFKLCVMEAYDLSCVECKYTEAEALNKMVEDSIRAYPEQYMWFLKVLKSRPEGFKPVYTKFKKAA